MTILDIQEFRATYNNTQPMNTSIDLDLNFFDATNNFQQQMTEEEFRYHYPQNPFANLPPQEFQIGNIDFSNITPRPDSIFDPNPLIKLIIINLIYYIFISTYNNEFFKMASVINRNKSVQKTQK